MQRRSQISTRTDTLCPYTTHFRSDRRIGDAVTDREQDAGIEGPQPPARQRVVQLLDAVPLMAHGLGAACPRCGLVFRSEEHTSELQSLMRISYAVFCLKKNKKHNPHTNIKYTFMSPKQHTRN